MITVLVLIPMLAFRGLQDGRLVLGRNRLAFLKKEQENWSKARSLLQEA